MFALVDIGAVFGPYTYLATEVAFGAVAVALLRYTGSLRRAARTVVALYPVAYVWDWYTLEIGVFEIPLRTGVAFLGIPVEEHVFMVVVPALVVGVHELLHDPDAGLGLGRDRRASARGATGATARESGRDGADEASGREESEPDA